MATKNRAAGAIYSTRSRTNRGSVLSTKRESKRGKRGRDKNETDKRNKSSKPGKGKHSFSRFLLSPHQKSVLAALMQGIQHLSETHVAFRESALLHYTMHYLMGEVPVQTLLETVERVKQQGDLIRLPASSGHRGEVYWTTPALLESEKTLLKAMHLPHATYRGIASPELLQAFTPTSLFQLVTAASPFVLCFP